MQTEPLAENWMDLADSTFVIPFGETSQEGFTLYEPYHQFFNELLQDIESYVATTEKVEFKLMLGSLEEYIAHKVTKGNSNYQQFVHFLNELTKPEVCYREYETFAILYEIPALPVYIKSKPYVEILRVSEQTQKVKKIKQPQRITLQRLKSLHPLYQPLNNRSIVIVGQVDHGKSSLLGRILLELNAVSPQSMTSSSLTSFTDIYASEQQRGKTFEFSRFSFVYNNTRLHLFDTPGHRGCLNNTLAAMRVADVVMLVISAKKGQFQAGFTNGTIKEVLQSACVFGKKHLVIVVTKMQTTNWDDIQYHRITSQLSTYINQKCNFSQVSFVGTDSLNSKSFWTSMIPDTVCMGEWFRDLKAQTVHPDDQQSRMVMPVFDVLAVYGQVHIVGKVEQGFISQGMIVRINPEGNSTSVMKIFQDEERIPYCRKGDFVALVLKNNPDLERGDIVTHNVALGSSKQILCQVENVSHNLLISGSEFIVHVLELIRYVRLQVKALITKDGKVTKGFLRHGEKGIVKLYFQELVCVIPGDHEGLIIRSDTKTVAFGQVYSTKKQVNTH